MITDLHSFKHERFCYWGGEGEVSHILFIQKEHFLVCLLHDTCMVYNMCALGISRSEHKETFDNYSYVPYLPNELHFVHL